MNRFTNIRLGRVKKWTLICIGSLLGFVGFMIMVFELDSHDSPIRVEIRNFTGSEFDLKFIAKNERNQDLWNTRFRLRKSNAKHAAGDQTWYSFLKPLDYGGFSIRAELTRPDQDTVLSSLEGSWNIVGFEPLYAIGAGGQEGGVYVFLIIEQAKGQPIIRFLDRDRGESWI